MSYREWVEDFEVNDYPIEEITMATRKKATPTIENTLAERGNRYGEFAGHAHVTQNIKRAMQESNNWASLDDDQKECLEMVAHKIGRILNGDPDYHDSWFDIIGYTKLVADRLDVMGNK